MTKYKVNQVDQVGLVDQVELADQVDQAYKVYQVNQTQAALVKISCMKH